MDMDKMHATIFCQTVQIWNEGCKYGVAYMESRVQITYVYNVKDVYNRTFIMVGHL